MPRKSRKDLLTSYRTKLKHAVRWRDEEKLDDTWDRLIQLYNGKQLDSVENDEDNIVVNLSFSNVNVLVPSVAVNHPKITVSPNTEETEDQAVIAEAVINYLWRHHGYQEPVKLAVKDSIIIGHGWIKTGWRFVEVEVGLTEPEAEREVIDLQGQADEFAALVPELAAELPTDEDIETQTSTKLIVKEDGPFVERVSPFDVYVDPEASHMGEALWVCQKIIRPIEEVREDENYKPAARRRVQGDMDLVNQRDWDRELRKRHNEDPEDKRVTIWEWWDLATNTFAVFAEGSDEFLIDPTPSPFVFGHPFEMIRNYDIPDKFYPMGDLEAIEPLQYELNKTRSQMMQARKKFARKYMVRQEAFSSDGRQALESDEDNRFVDVISNDPFENILAPLPQVPLPPELYNHSQIIETDIQDVSGIAEIQRGQVPETTRTATEAAIISDALNARSADKLSNVERFMARVARRVLQLMQQYMTEDQVARIAGPNGRPFWVRYGHDDILGEFDFDVEAGSTQPQNETQRRQTAVQLIQALAPFMAPEVGIINPEALVKHMLQFGFGIKNPSKFLMNQVPLDPSGDPVQQALPPGDPSGVGGPQGPPPTPDGFPDSETGESPQDLATLAQLEGQVGLGFGG